MIEQSEIILASDIENIGGVPFIYETSEPVLTISIDKSKGIMIIVSKGVMIKNNTSVDLYFDVIRQLSTYDTWTANNNLLVRTLTIKAGATGTLIDFGSFTGGERNCLSIVRWTGRSGAGQN